MSEDGRLEWKWKLVEVPVELVASGGLFRPVATRHPFQPSMTLGCQKVTGTLKLS